MAPDRRKEWNGAVAFIAIVLGGMGLRRPRAPVSVVRPLGAWSHGDRPAWMGAPVAAPAVPKRPRARCLRMQIDETVQVLRQLRHRVNLRELMQPYVGEFGERAGRVFCLCPFHSEKTPSCLIDEKQGRYYCFGCGAKGNAVSFLMHVKRIGYREAVAELATRAGIPPPAVTPRPSPPPPPSPPSFPDAPPSPPSNPASRWPSMRTSASSSPSAPSSSSSSPPLLRSVSKLAARRARGRRRKASLGEMEQLQEAARKRDRRRHLLRVNALAMRFFRRQWHRPGTVFDAHWRDAARRYLAEQRGLSAEVIEAFGIGYAPNSWRALFHYMLYEQDEMDVNEEDLAELGLVKRHQGAPRYARNKPVGDTSLSRLYFYDAFRNRIMIPIRDARGNVVGFGARLVGTQQTPPPPPRILIYDLEDNLETRQVLDAYNRIERMGRGDADKLGDGRADFAEPREEDGEEEEEGGGEEEAAEARGREEEQRAAPKYINSRESDVFHKSRALFGSDQVLEAAEARWRAATTDGDQTGSGTTWSPSVPPAMRPTYLILVEGYMDVLALFQHGIPYAVASMGTAVTAEQMVAAWELALKVARLEASAAPSKTSLEAAPAAESPWDIGASEAAWTTSGLEFGGKFGRVEAESWGDAWAAAKWRGSSPQPPRIVLQMDNDEAGHRAAHRTVELLMGGIPSALRDQLLPCLGHVMIATLPDGFKDADEFVRLRGHDAYWQQVIGRAERWWEWRIRLRLDETLRQVRRQLEWSTAPADALMADLEPLSDCLRDVAHVLRAAELPEDELLVACEAVAERILCSLPDALYDTQLLQDIADDVAEQALPRESLMDGAERSASQRAVPEKIGPIRAEELPPRDEVFERQRMELELLDMVVRASAAQRTAWRERLTAEGLELRHLFTDTLLRRVSGRVLGMEGESGVEEVPYDAERDEPEAHALDDCSQLEEPPQILAALLAQRVISERDLCDELSDAVQRDGGREGAGTLVYIPREMFQARPGSGGEAGAARWRQSAAEALQESLCSGFGSVPATDSDSERPASEATSHTEAAADGAVSPDPAWWLSRASATRPRRPRDAAFWLLLQHMLKPAMQQEYMQASAEWRIACESLLRRRAARQSAREPPETSSSSSSTTSDAYTTAGGEKAALQQQDADAGKTPPEGAGNSDDALAELYNDPECRADLERALQCEARQKWALEKMNLRDI